MSLLTRAVLIAAADVAAAVAANLVADALGNRSIGYIVTLVIVAVGLSLLASEAREKASPRNRDRTAPAAARRNVEPSSVTAARPTPLSQARVVSSAPLTGLSYSPAHTPPQDSPRPFVSASSSALPDRFSGWARLIAVGTVMVGLIVGIVYWVGREDARLIAVLPGHGQVVNDITFKDEQTLCSLGGDIRMWNTETHQQVGMLKDDWIINGVFTPDCARVAVALRDGVVVERSTVNLAETRRIPAHPDFATGMAYSRDGSFLATARSYAQLFHGNRQIGGKIMDDYGLLTVALSPDGSRLASGSEGHWVTVRTVPSLTTERKLDTGMWNASWALAFSPDGKLLAVGGKGGEVFLFDVASGELVRTLAGDDEEWLHEIVFSPDGKLVAAGMSDIVRVWNVASGQQIGEPLRGHWSSVRALAFSPSGKAFASAGEEGEIRIWDLSAT